MSEETKTIKEWLEELPEPYRTQALEDYDPEFCNNTDFCDTDQCLATAVECAFSWSRSSQGRAYWAVVVCKIRRGTLADEPECDTFDERPLERKKPASVFTDDSDRRKEFPVYSLLMYFPKSLAALTALAVEGNKKHSPDRDPYDLEWVRDKSSDHKECIARHMIDGDWVELAMRAMMNLEVELENGYEKS